MFNDFEYTKAYIPVYNENSKESVALPVYKFDDTHTRTYDPFKGTLLTANNEDKIIEYADVNGHYAQKEINILRKYGIGFEGGMFKPDEIITKSQFAALTNSVFGKNRFPVIMKSTNADINDETEDNDPLTRATACIELIDAMGYDEIAKMDSIFLPQFADVKENVGYIAILAKMGVVSGDGSGNFSPDEYLTRADAAIMIYNFLSK